MADDRVVHGGRLGHGCVGRASVASARLAQPWHGRRSPVRARNSGGSAWRVPPLARRTAFAGPSAPSPCRRSRDRSRWRTRSTIRPARRRRSPPNRRGGVICRSSSQPTASRMAGLLGPHAAVPPSARTRNRRVPDRRLAGLQPRRAAASGRRSPGRRSCLWQYCSLGAVVGIAQALQGHDAPDDGRIDRPQAVAVVEAGEHPPLGGGQRLAPQRQQPPPLAPLQQPVDSAEEAVPTQQARCRRSSPDTAAAASPPAPAGTTRGCPAAARCRRTGRNAEMIDSGTMIVRDQELTA